MVVDEENEIINGNVGKIPVKDLLDFINIAEKHKTKCLQFIDVTGDTLFSEKQMRQIREELFFLKHDPLVNQGIIAIIEKGIDEALLENFDYLKFQGL